MKYYNSIEELENCIGKFVYLYYTNNGVKDGVVILFAHGFMSYGSFSPLFGVLW